MSTEKSKYERVNRFLFKCGALWRDEVVENPPNIDAVMEKMQDGAIRDTVEAVISFEKLGVTRKLKAIGNVMELSVDELPKVKNRNSHYIKHAETVNVWDYIVRISRREDWMDYTLKGYDLMDKGEQNVE